MQHADRQVKGDGRLKSRILEIMLCDPTSSLLAWRHDNEKVNKTEVRLLHTATRANS
jgi:hypothetical protein